MWSNLDARFEWFFAQGEYLTLGVFHKLLEVVGRKVRIGGDHHGGGRRHAGAVRVVDVGVIDGDLQRFRIRQRSVQVPAAGRFIGDQRIVDVIEAMRLGGRPVGLDPDRPPHLKKVTRTS